MASYKNSQFQRVLVFGDSTVENKLPFVRDLWKASESSSLLRRFLQQAIGIIQDEAQKLNSSEGELFLCCINVLEVAEAYAEMEEPDEVIASVLVLVTRLGELVLHAERNPGSRVSQNTLHILGFCTGLLPGAVAACAKDTDAIFNLSCEVLAISFRLVISLVRRSKAIEQQPGLWATTMIGVPREQLQVELNQFNRNEHLPKEKQAYIGVSSRSWNTVFGPPSIIEKVSETCPVLSEMSQIRTIAAMAVHATHLSRPDINWIMGNSDDLNTPVLPNVSIISTSTGSPYVATTLRDLIRMAIADIATNILDIDRTIQGVTTNLDKSTPVKILAVGPSPNVLTITRILASKNFQVETSGVLASDKQRRLVPQGRMTVRRRVSKH